MAIEEINRSDIPASAYTEKINEIIRSQDKTVYCKNSDYPQLYAWKLQNYICYTKTAAPEINDEVYDKDGNYFDVPDSGKTVDVARVTAYYNDSQLNIFIHYTDNTTTSLDLLNRTQSEDLPKILVDKNNNKIDIGSISKSGDTMNGALHIETDNTSENSLYVAKLTEVQYQNTPAENQFIHCFQVQDKNGNVLGDIEYTKRTDGSYNIALVCKNNANSTYSSLVAGFDENGNPFQQANNTPAANDNSKKIATTEFVKQATDGQWVNITNTNTQLIYSGDLYHVNGDNLVRPINCIPNDGKTYEILFTGQVTTAPNTGEAIYLSMKTNKITDWVHICGARTRANAAVGNRGNGVLAATYGNNLTIYRSNSFKKNTTSQTGSTVEIRAKAYRRVGNNT